MITLPVECWKTPKTEDTHWAPPRPETTERPEDPSSPTNSRITNRSDGISTKAVLGSLVMLCALGTGAFLLMHSVVFGDARSSTEPAMAEPNVAVVSGALTIQPLIIPPPPPPPSPPSFLESAIANPPSIQPVPSAPPSKATRLPTVLPHVRVHVYPFPVFAGQGTTLARGTPSADLATSLPSEEISGTNPYNEVPEAKTNAAPRSPLHADDVPSDHPGGSRE